MDSENVRIYRCILHTLSTSLDRKHIVQVWQKLRANRAICCQLVVTVKLTFLTGQENTFPHNFSVITNQNTPKALKPLLFLPVCVRVIKFYVSATGFLKFLTFCSFSPKLSNFRDFIIVHIERISGAGLHQPIIYSLTWIFSHSGSPLTEQMLSTISSRLDLKRHWTWCCLFDK